MRKGVNGHSASTSRAKASKSGQNRIGQGKQGVHLGKQNYNTRLFGASES